MLLLKKMPTKKNHAGCAVPPLREMMSLRQVPFYTLLLPMALAFFSFHCLQAGADCNGDTSLDPTNGCQPIIIKTEPPGSQTSCPPLEVSKAEKKVSIKQACQLIDHRDALRKQYFDAGYTYTLEANLDFGPIFEDSKNKSFKPLGKAFGSTVPFLGTFDGNGKKILGLIIGEEGDHKKGDDDFSVNQVGLFARVGGTGKVRDLTFIAPEVRGKDGVGVLAGRIKEGSEISNIVVEGGFVQGRNNVGGIVGQNQGGIVRGARLMDYAGKKSQVLGHVSVGGVVGNTNSEGVVTSKLCDRNEYEDSPGVICEADHNKKITAKYLSDSVAVEYKKGQEVASYSEGEVLATKGPVGGVVGSASEGSLLYGLLSKAQVGQIACEAAEGGVDSLVCGVKRLACSVLEVACTKSTLSAGAGGVLGLLEGVEGDETTTLSYSYAWPGSKVEAKSKVGGVVGFATGGLIEYSGSEAEAGGNRAEVAGQTSVGGLLGEVGKEESSAEGVAVLVKQSYSKALVKGSVSSAGGLVGRLSGKEARVTHSYAVGPVEAEDAHEVGGLVGRVDGAAKLEHSYAGSTVHGARCVGGLVGRLGYDGSVGCADSADSADSAGIIRNAYAEGGVSGSSQVGGLVGRFAGTSTSTSSGTIESSIFKSYARVEISQQASAEEDNSIFGGLVGHKGKDATIEKSYSASRILGSQANADERSLAAFIGACEAETSEDSVIDSRLYGLSDYQIPSLGRSCRVLSQKVVLRSLSYLEDMLTEGPNDDAQRAGDGLDWSLDYAAGEENVGVLWGQLDVLDKFPCLQGMPPTSFECSEVTESQPEIGDCPGESFLKLPCLSEESNSLRTDSVPNFDLSYRDDASLLSFGMAPASILDEDVSFTWASYEDEEFSSSYGLRYELSWKEKVGDFACVQAPVSTDFLEENKFYYDTSASSDYLFPTEKLGVVAGTKNFCFYVRACDDYRQCTPYSSNAISLTYDPSSKLKSPRLLGRVGEVEGVELRWEDGNANDVGLYRIERWFEPSGEETEGKWDVCSPNSGNVEEENLSCCDGGASRVGRYPGPEATDPYTYFCQGKSSLHTLTKYRIAFCPRNGSGENLCGERIAFSDLANVVVSNEAFLSSFQPQSDGLGGYVTEVSHVYKEIKPIIGWMPQLPLPQGKYWQTGLSDSSSASGSAYTFRYELQHRRKKYGSSSFGDWSSAAFKEHDGDESVQEKAVVWAWGDEYLYRLRLCAQIKGTISILELEEACSPWVEASTTNDDPWTFQRRAKFIGEPSSEINTGTVFFESTWTVQNALGYEVTWNSRGNTIRGEYKLLDCGADDTVEEGHEEHCSGGEAELCKGELTSRKCTYNIKGRRSVPPARELNLEQVGKGTSTRTLAEPISWFKDVNGEDGARVYEISFKPCYDLAIPASCSIEQDFNEVTYKPLAPFDGNQTVPAEVKGPGEAGGDGVFDMSVTWFPSATGSPEWYALGWEARMHSDSQESGSWDRENKNRGFFYVAASRGSSNGPCRVADDRSVGCIFSPPRYYSDFRFNVYSCRGALPSSDLKAAELVEFVASSDCSKGNNESYVNGSDGKQKIVEFTNKPPAPLGTVAAPSHKENITGANERAWFDLAWVPQQRGKVKYYRLARRLQAGPDDDNAPHEGDTLLYGEVEDTETSQIYLVPNSEIDIGEMDDATFSTETPSGTVPDPVCSHSGSEERYCLNNYITDLSYPYAYTYFVLACAYNTGDDPEAESCQYKNAVTLSTRRCLAADGLERGSGFNFSRLQALTNEGSAVSAFNKGDPFHDGSSLGSQANPLLLCNPKDFTALRESLEKYANDGEVYAPEGSSRASFVDQKKTPTAILKERRVTFANSSEYYLNKHIILGANIDFGGETLKPLGVDNGSPGSEPCSLYNKYRRPIPAELPWSLTRETTGARAHLGAGSWTKPTNGDDSEHTGDNRYTGEYKDWRRLYERSPDPFNASFEEDGETLFRDPAPSAAFSGNFDGGGHTLSNFKIENQSTMSVKRRLYFQSFSPYSYHDDTYVPRLKSGWCIWDFCYYAWEPLWGRRLNRVYNSGYNEDARYTSRDPRQEFSDQTRYLDDEDKLGDEERELVPTDEQTKLTREYVDKEEEFNYSNRAVGLFGCVAGAKAQVKNLRLDRVVVEAKSFEASSDSAKTYASKIQLKTHRTRPYENSFCRVYHGFRTVENALSKRGYALSFPLRSPGQLIWGWRNTCLYSHEGEELVYQPVQPRKLYAGVLAGRVVDGALIENVHLGKVSIRAQSVADKDSVESRPKKKGFTGGIRECFIKNGEVGCQGLGEAFVTDADIADGEKHPGWQTLEVFDLADLGRNAVIVGGLVGQNYGATITQSSVDRVILDSLVSQTSPGPPPEEINGEPEENEEGPSYPMGIISGGLVGWNGYAFGDKPPLKGIPIRRYSNKGLARSLINSNDEAERKAALETEAEDRYELWKGGVAKGFPELSEFPKSKVERSYVRYKQSRFRFRCSSGGDDGCQKNTDEQEAYVGGLVGYNGNDRVDVSTGESITRDDALVQATIKNSFVGTLELRPLAPILPVLSEDANADGIEEFFTSNSVSATLTAPEIQGVFFDFEVDGLGVGTLENKYFGGGIKFILGALVGLQHNVGGVSFSPSVRNSYALFVHSDLMNSADKASLETKLGGAAIFPAGATFTMVNENPTLGSDQRGDDNQLLENLFALDRDSYTGFGDSYDPHFLTTGQVAHYGLDTSLFSLEDLGGGVNANGNIPLFWKRTEWENSQNAAHKEHSFWFFEENQLSTEESPPPALRFDADGDGLYCSLRPSIVKDLTGYGSLAEKIQNAVKIILTELDADTKDEGDDDNNDPACQSTKMRNAQKEINSENYIISYIKGFIPWGN